MKQINKTIILIFSLLALLYLDNKFNIIGNITRHLFVKVRTEIRSTPTIIKNVLQTSQLISSEYCTETYCTHSDEFIFDIDHYIEQRKSDLESAFNQVKNEIIKLKDNGVSIERLHTGFVQKSSLEDLRQYHNVITLIDLCGGNEGEKNKCFKNEILNADWRGFQGNKVKKHFKQMSEDLEDIQENNKADIIYIGRGCVQAGIDFDAISKNLQVTQINESTLKITGMSSTIISAHINPWFIPGKIKGFEFWDSHKEKRLSYKDVPVTKSKCVHNIEQEAIGNGIKLKAIESGLYAISQLSNQMDSKIDSIIVEIPYYNYVNEMILADSIISTAEINNLDGNYYNLSKTIDNGTQILIQDNRSNAMMEHVGQLIEFCQRNVDCKTRTLVELIKVKKKIAS